MPHQQIESGAETLPYDVDSIVVLSGVDAVRKRPALYVGSTGAEGLHHLAFELVENAVDEFLAGACHAIDVELFEDGSCAVSDDGRGIPVSLHPVEGRPTVEVLLTHLHSGGKFSGTAYGFSGGLHGVGLTCVNALSEWLVLEVWRDGRLYRQDYRRGRPVEPLRDAGPAVRRGTRIQVRPDPTIFTDGMGFSPGFSYDLIAARLRELAFLNPGLTLRIADARDGRHDTFRFADGLRGLVLDLNRNRPAALHDDPVVCQGGRNGIGVQIALQWTTSYADEIISFVNSVRTVEGGSHVDGLKQALAQTISGYMRSAGLLTEEERHEAITAGDVLEGLTAVLAVELSDAQFASQTKAQLVTRAVSGVVGQVLAEGAARFFAERPEAARAIAGKVLEAQRTRIAARRPSLGVRYFRQEMARSLEVYRKQFGTRAKNWHDSCVWLTDGGLLQAHVDMLDVGPEARMLDVCCGSGVVGASFGNRVAHKTGLDITPEMRAMARTRLDAVEEGSVYAMPFPDASFDVVVTREVLHLLPDPQRPLGEILRVLRPGGQFIFGQTVPYGAVDAAWSFRIFKKKQPLFCNNFLAEDLDVLLARVGFERIARTEHRLWEPIDLWIDTHETTALHRQEIRELYHHAPLDVREIHPFEIAPDGRIRDLWRWCVFSARRPL
ncbi:methyltransferase domain-containing protein [Azospirillum sp. B506]|uniref:methyltransferase domain-containing protein n=1 Tax=Azospirillum sp. B506 TaxID=137721 RepID=UPI00034746EE|nr:methyltransferase domain-containing protein [Azospirillum sp. B506]